MNKPTVAIIDDCEDAAYFLKVAIRDKYEVLVYDNAREFLDFIEFEKPTIDVVISDINMPQMTGIELIRNLRLIPNYINTPIVALTAYNEEAFTQLLLDAGFDKTLVKPFNLKYLHDLLEGYTDTLITV